MFWLTIMNWAIFNQVLELQAGQARSGIYSYISRGNSTGYRTTLDNRIMDEESKNAKIVIIKTPIYK